MAPVHTYSDADGGKDAARGIDLSSYEVPSKGRVHLGLAIQKTLRLKSRKPRGCLCEMLLPPFFVCALMIGYFASDDDFDASENYAANDVLNTTSMVNEVLCTYGFDQQKQRAAPYLAECPGAECLPLWYNPHTTEPITALCLNPNIVEHGYYKPLKELYHDLVFSTHNGTSIPPFDTLVALQRVVRFVASKLNVNIDSYWGSLQHSGNLEFVASSCEDARQLMDHLNATTKFFDYIVDRTIPRDFPGCEYVWRSEKAAVHYAQNDGAGKTWAVVVLNDIDATRGVFDYTLRMNYTSTPYTMLKEDKFVQGLGKHRARQYINSGFTTLQNHIDAYYVNTVAPNATARAVPPRRFELVEAASIPMPTDSYVHSQFLSHAGSLIPLVLCFSFLYPVSCLVGGIVEEKEQRLREGMLIMGLSKRSFYLSWFLSYCVLVTVSSGLITLAMCLTWMDDSSPLLVFVITELFGVSVVAMGLLISVFFSKARIAAIVSPLITFITVVPKFTIPANVGVSTRLGISTLSACAYAYAADLMTNYEKRGSGSGFAEFFQDDYSYAWACAMMLMDTLLYLLLAWYLDLVLPSQYGVKLHPLFFLKASYWRPADGSAADAEALGRSSPAMPSRLPFYVDTEYDASTRDDLAARERVRIMGLRMEFESTEGKGKKNVAVNNLGSGTPKDSPGGADALSFYEGQVQCVLGHNGAGKTTLINMMTGMLQPTSGDCTIWGTSIRSGMDRIRESIGFCPQHNILWARMSCEEHLMFYGRIKGVPTEVLKVRVAEMLKLVNLYEKKKAWSEVLSGGQKRKLSVACALIGGSKLVFLDEPTAGMDVESRRAIWTLLRNPDVLRGRVIVLTTHYMEEADILGDSVAIMHKGCLHSWGSPFFLKNRLGVGYNMAVSMGKGCDPEKVEDVVRRHVSRADVTRMSCTGTELRLRLPMDSRPEAAFVDLARQSLGIGYAGNPSKLRDELLAAAATARGEEREACERVLQNVRTVSSFPAMFDELEGSKEALQVEGYGVGVTTLEEVFMRIALAEDDIEDEDGARVSVDPAQYDFSTLYTQRSSDDPSKSGMALYVDQFQGMFLKRFRCALRDRRTICFQFIIPMLFILVALLLGMLGPPVQPSIALDAHLFGHHSQIAYSVPQDDAGVYTAANFPGYNLLDVDSGRRTRLGFDGLSEYLLNTTGEHRHGTTRQIALSTLPGAQPEGSVVLENGTYIHALPAGLNAVHNAFVRSIYAESGRAGASLLARNHPLPLSEYAQKVISEIQVTVTGIFIMIPFTFIPSSFVAFVVKERECKAKHVQVVSGAHLAAYWLSSFLFDLVSYCVTLVVAFSIFFAAGRTEFVGDAETFAASSLLFFMYGVAAIMSSYFLSFLFSSHTTAQNAVMAFNFITGFILVLTVQTLDMVSSTKHVNGQLKYVYRMVPSYCLGEGIIRLSVRGLVKAVDSDYLGSSDGPFSKEVTAWDLIYLGFMTPVFFLLTLMIEAPILRHAVTSAKRSLVRLFTRRGRRGGSGAARGQLQAEGRVVNSGDEESEEDETHGEGAALLQDAGAEDDWEDGGENTCLPRDGPEVVHRRGGWLRCVDAEGALYYFNEVTGESKRSDRDTPFYRDERVAAHAREVVRDGVQPDDSVTVLRLRKVWPARGNASEKVAVHDLSFNVPSGELFAFLGTNGAGKTTTLSVLSGEFEPTAGRAYIAGHDVVSSPQLARQNLGFCPQFDALLDHLTCEEHLDLFARLRGIPVRHRKPSAELLLGGLGLTDHRKKLASKLSGGNRRKLSVAVALMGGPPVVFLDEPSAGMDPLARRSLWGALEKA
eukprot:Rhum_TRINITY_DN13434_c0_g1::Rhum_TRINITY_DN13434_c0_g1_i1::g.60210::m.60210/K05643/ABCA3; ATP-binding cassette, subfamily A (ABC1), member 3